MSKTIIFALVVISAVSSCKSPSKKEASSDNSQAVELFNNAVKLKDYVTATVAANQILLQDSSRTDLYDTLAKYYIYNQNAIGARIMTEKALKVNANNFKMLENAAVFDQMDGNFEIAQTKLQKCYEATKQSKYQYKLAENYAQMTQYKSSDSMLNLILAQDSSKNMMMEDAPRVEGGVQSVKLLAKVYLLKAKIASLVLGPKDPRVPKFQKEYVNLSLSIQPDYEEALYIKQQNRL